MSVMSSIEISNVRKKYRSVTLTFPDVTFTNSTIILGPNGSGKSTLLKAIMGLIEYDGTIAYQGRLQYLPEHPTFPKDISMRTFLHAFVTELPIDLLQRFALIAKLDEPLNTLSKGMLGKLNLITCLMEDAAWYLLDEPVNGLDHAAMEELFEWLQTTNKRWIVTTHLPYVKERLQKDVIHLDPHS